MATLVIGTEANQVSGSRLLICRCDQNVITPQNFKATQKSTSSPLISSRLVTRITDCDHRFKSPRRHADSKYSFSHAPRCGDPQLLRSVFVLQTSFRPRRMPTSVRRRVRQRIFGSLILPTRIILFQLVILRLQ